MTPEGKITKQIIDFLKSLKKEGRRIWWHKLHGHPMQTAGVPDLLVIFEGRHVFFEIKGPKGKLTDLQRIRILEIYAAGGHVFVVYTAKDVKSILLGSVFTKKKGEF